MPKFGNREACCVLEISTSGCGLHVLGARSHVPGSDLLGAPRCASFAATHQEAAAVGFL
jgi:hypothetical protein